jgi:hypothetical protein
VKQLLSTGLVNIAAVFTPQPDGTIKVENSAPMDLTARRGKPPGLRFQSTPPTPAST